MCVLRAWGTAGWVVRWGSKIAKCVRCSVCRHWSRRCQRSWMMRTIGILALLMGGAPSSRSEVSADRGPILVSTKGFRHGTAVESSARGVSADGVRVLFSAPSWHRAAHSAGFLDRSQLWVAKAANGNARIVTRRMGHRSNGEVYFGGMSGDGMRIVFTEPAWFSGNLFVRDRTEGRTRSVLDAVGADLVSGTLYRGACISGDGDLVAFYSENEAAGGPGRQVCLADLETGEFRVLSRTSGGEFGLDWSESPSISPDGRYVAYHTTSQNLIADAVAGEMPSTYPAILVFDRDTGLTHLASVSSSGTTVHGGSYFASVSDNGLVAFNSDAEDLVPGDANGVSDVFVHDLETGQTQLISTDVGGGQRQRDSYWGALSGDGSVVAFVSEDSSEVTNIYCHDMSTGLTRLVSADADGIAGNGASEIYGNCLSYDGTWCVFDSTATNLIPNDRNGSARDVFLVRLR